MIGSTLVRHGNDDLLIANCARVSFNRRSDEFSDRDARLVRYLIEHDHWSPLAHPHLLLRREMDVRDFGHYLAEAGAGHRVVITGSIYGTVVFIEAASAWFHLRNGKWSDAGARTALAYRMPHALTQTTMADPGQDLVTLEDLTDRDPEVERDRLLAYPVSVQEAARLLTLTFHVKASVFVARQLAKHQVDLVWNEISRRYVDDEPEIYFPTTWRKRARDKKQGSGEETVEFLRRENGDWGPQEVRGFVEDAVGLARDVYEVLLAAEVAPEQARMVLPQSMITEWYWTGSAEAFARVCRLRRAPDAQRETSEVVAGIEAALQDLLPELSLWLDD